MWDRHPGRYTQNGAILVPAGGLSPTRSFDFTTESLDAAITFTRSGAANRFNASGLLESIATNLPRFDYDPVGLTLRGLLLEELRTNVVLWNRDLTNAAWTKSNITAVKDQTGIDGVSNSASKITAGAANGTVLQAITLASSARFQSAYVKRVTGSGTVEMTTNGGTNWTAITVTGAWTRVTIPTATLANPSVGFRIVTSGDAIAVDYVQNEDGVHQTSPIGTTTASVTRDTDVAEVTGTNFTSWYNNTASTFVVQAIKPYPPTATDDFMFLTLGGASNPQMAMMATDFLAADSAYCEIKPSAGNQAGISLGASTWPGDNTSRKLGFAYAANDAAASINGGTVATDTTVDVPTLAQMMFGGRPGTGVRSINGWMQRVDYYNSRVSNAQLQALTA